MSTSSVGLTSSGGTNSNGSTIFNGTSRYSADFQNEIATDVAVASIPYQQLQTQVGTLQGQSSELGTLSTEFTNLQSTVQQLETAASSALLAATSSDTTIAQPTIAAGAQAGTYTLDVTSLGSSTNTLSQAGSTPVTDPSTQNISASSSFTLTVNGTATTITPSASTLDSLVSAINSNSSLGVQASIVNLGSSSSPDYRLSIQSNELGPDTIQLNDGTSDLLSNISTGSPASYQVDGVTTPVTSTSRTITLAPGLTVDLVGENTSGVSTTITVAPSTSSIQSALSSFVTSYNSVFSELQNNVGQAGGALQGDSVVYELTNALQNLGGYVNGSGSVNSLASLGVTYDQTGKLSFDASTFASATANQISSLTSFLGDTSTGGFLQFASNQLSSILTPTTGLIPDATSSLQSQITNDNTLIANDQVQVNTLQTNLTSQLSASDALVASLEQNYSLVQGLFQAQLNNSSVNSLGY
jgi:flagellar hook-associated protein 2